ncbi:MAG: DUF3078 domain-containing protein [Chitinophagaceae bacterium]
MKKGLLVVLTGLFFAGQAQAQLTETEKLQKSLSLENKDTVAWVHSGVFQFGLNQGYLHNWAAGGEVVSLAVDGLFSGNITRLYHNQVWSNSLDASYSLFYAYSNHFVPRKVDDRIDFTSKYGHKLKSQKNIYFTGLFNFKSQFTKGYDYTLPDFQKTSTSNFLSPAYLTLAAGMEYRKGSDISLFLSPLALRYTLVDKVYTLRDPAGAYGVPYGKTSRLELGAYFSGRYVHDITPNIKFKTSLDLYSNYLAKNRYDSTGSVLVKKNNPGNINIYWDNLISIKVSKYINLNLSLTAIYDNDQPYQSTYPDPVTGLPVDKNEPGTSLGWWQIKEVMAFSFVYKF